MPTSPYTNTIRILHTVDIKGLYMPVKTAGFYDLKIDQSYQNFCAFNIQITTDAMPLKTKDNRK